MRAFALAALCGLLGAAIGAAWAWSNPTEPQAPTATGSVIRSIYDNRSRTRPIGKLYAFE